MIKICNELRDERQSIINFLKVMKVIELDKNDGFQKEL